MADQKFLASFGVEIDETGLLRLQEALTKNRALADELASAFEHAQEAMKSFFDSMSEMSMPSLDFGASPTGTLPNGAASGRKMILSTDVIGFQPGEEMTLEFEGAVTKGLILSRMVEADSYSGPWKTELLIEIHS